MVSIEPFIFTTPQIFFYEKFKKSQLYHIHNKYCF